MLPFGDVITRSPLDSFGGRLLPAPAGLAGGVSSGALPMRGPSADGAVVPLNLLSMCIPRGLMRAGNIGIENLAV